MCLTKQFYEFDTVLEERPMDPEAFARRWFCDPKRRAEVEEHAGGVGFDMGIYR